MTLKTQCYKILKKGSGLIKVQFSNVRFHRCLDHLKTDLQKVQISNVSGFRMSGFWIPKVLDKSVFQFMFSIFVVGVVLHAPILGDRSGPSHEHRRVSQLPLSTLLRYHWKGKSLFVYDVTQLRLVSDQLNPTMTVEI